MSLSSSSLGTAAARPRTQAALKTCGAASAAQLGGRLRTAAGARLVLGSLFGGVGPHTYANLGPDVLCMGFARAVYNAVNPKPQRAAKGDGGGDGAAAGAATAAK